MPIVFQPASPMAPEIASGGGAAEVATHDFAALAGLYEAANKNHLAASEASAHNATQAGIAGAQMMNQSSMAADQLGQRQHEFQASQQVSDRDNWMANVQAHAAQQHAQLQAWVQGQELSQSEQMELQRNQNSIGTINGMRSRGEITNETADAMLGQVIPRINAAQARHQMALAKQEEANAKKANEAVILQQAHRQTQQDFAAKYVKNGAMYTDDHDNIIPPDQVDSFQGTKHLHLQNQHGVFTRTNPKADKESPTVDDTGRTAKEYLKDQKDALHAADAEIARLEKTSPTGERIPASPEQRRDMENLYLDRVKARGDFKPRGGQTQFDNTPPTTGQPLPPPPKPWTWDPHNREQTPEDKLEPQQRQVVAGYKNTLAVINNGPLTDADKKDAKDALDERLKLVQEKGPPELMKPSDQAKYRALDQRIVAKFPAQAPPQAPPKPPNWWQRNMQGPGGKTFFFNNQIGSGSDG